MTNLIDPARRPVSIKVNDSPHNREDIELWTQVGEIGGMVAIRRDAFPAEVVMELRRLAKFLEIELGKTEKK